MAYIAYSGVTENSISVYLDGLDSSYSLYDRQAEWYIGTSSSTAVLDGYALIPAFVTQGGNYTFINLQPSTTYYIDCCVITNMGRVWVTGIYITTSAPAPVRPPLFSWTYAKISGQPFNLTAAEWNGLENNINGVRYYKGYLNYPFSTAYTGAIFTAGHYNQAVMAIKEISGYGAYLSTVNTGDTIYASQMNMLVSEINAVP